MTMTCLLAVALAAQPAAPLPVVSEFAPGLHSYLVQLGFRPEVPDLSMTWRDNDKELRVWFHADQGMPFTDRRKLIEGRGAKSIEHPAIKEHLDRLQGFMTVTGNGVRIMAPLQDGFLSCTLSNVVSSSRHWILAPEHLLRGGDRGINPIVEEVRWHYDESALRRVAELMEQLVAETKRHGWIERVQGAASPIAAAGFRPSSFGSPSAPSMPRFHRGELSLHISALRREEAERWWSPFRSNTIPSPFKNPPLDRAGMKSYTRGTKYTPFVDVTIGDWTYTMFLAPRPQGPYQELDQAVVNELNRIALRFQALAVNRR
jgi:hypothetical protein